MCEDDRVGRKNNSLRVSRTDERWKLYVCTTPVQNVSSRVLCSSRGARTDGRSSLVAGATPTNHIAPTTNQLQQLAMLRKAHKGWYCWLSKPSQSENRSSNFTFRFFEFYLILIHPKKRRCLVLEGIYIHYQKKSSNSYFNNLKYYSLFCTSKLIREVITMFELYFKTTGIFAPDVLIRYVAIIIWYRNTFNPKHP